MTANSDSVSKREKIRRKVAESEAGLARQHLPHGSPPDGVRSLAMDYPFALIFGGLAIGVIAGAMIPRAAGKRLGKGAAAAAAIASEFALAYGQRALDATGKAAEDGRVRASELGGAVSDGVSTYGGKAADVLGGVGKAAVEAALDTAGTARHSGRRLARRAIALAANLRH